MSKYILELIDREGTFIEHLCTSNSEAEFNPTTTTMNAFKAEQFSEDEIDEIEWFAEEGREKFGTLIKVVRIL